MMDAEEKDMENQGNLDNEQIVEEVAQKEPETSDFNEMNEEELEFRKKLNDKLEVERQLTLVLQQKEKQAKNLSKRYQKLKDQLWEQAKQEKSSISEVKVDFSLSKEISMLKDKMKEKNYRLELLEKELDSHNKAQAEMYHQRFKNMDELQNYQKLSNENPHLEAYLKSEYYRSSLDKIQALKQLAEQLSFEIDRATAVKTELEEDKGRFDLYLKQVRSEFKKLQDENERLADEADRRKNSF